jgi:hypothetical protein
MPSRAHIECLRVGHCVNASKVYLGSAIAFGLVWNHPSLSPAVKGRMGRNGGDGSVNVSVDPGP